MAANVVTYIVTLSTILVLLVVNAILRATTVRVETHNLSECYPCCYARHLSKDI